VAARAIAVLTELGLVDEGALSVHPAPARTSLEASPAYRAYTLRLEDGRRYLTTLTTGTGPRTAQEQATAAA
jgi:hypothetical protein